MTQFCEWTYLRASFTNEILKHHDVTNIHLVDFEHFYVRRIEINQCSIVCFSSILSGLFAVTMWSCRFEIIIELKTRADKERKKSANTISSLVQFSWLNKVKKIYAYRIRYEFLRSALQNREHGNHKSKCNHKPHARPTRKKSTR